ncbi:MAG: alpha/beta hydrolase family protein [Acidimicrobiales bacterium]
MPRPLRHVHGRVPLASAGLALAMAATGLAGCRGTRSSGPPSTPLALPTTTGAPAPSSSTKTGSAPSSTATTTAPAKAPPYPVSSTTMAFVDPSRPTVSQGVQISATMALTTVVWYPAVAGRWPLVMFASGYKVGPSSYSTLLQTWAAAGYVVAAPEFPLEDEAIAGPALDESDLQNEPADLEFVKSSMLARSDPLAPRIIATEVAVTGHSDGAEAALAVAQEGDPQVVAVIAMSGQPVTPRQDPNPPLLVIQGDSDTTNPPELGQDVYDQADSPKFFLSLIGGGHLPPFQAGSVWEPLIATTTIDFFNHYLSERVTSDGAMLTAGNQPGVASIS